MILYLKLAAAALALAGAAYGGYQWRDGIAAEEDLARERAAAEQIAAIQKGMDLAAQETERRLAVAARNLAAARSDSERLRRLADDARSAADQAGEHLDERGRELARLLGEGAGLVGEVRGLLAEGEGLSERIAARQAGCALAP